MDYYDPVTKRWSFERGDPDWHWPWTFTIVVFGIVGSVIGLVALVI